MDEKEKRFKGKKIVDIFLVPSSPFNILHEFPKETDLPHGTLLTYAKVHRSLVQLKRMIVEQLAGIEVVVNYIHSKSPETPESKKSSTLSSSAGLLKSSEPDTMDGLDEASTEGLSEDDDADLGVFELQDDGEWSA